VLREAEDLGVKRALGTGLLLAQGLLGATVPSSLGQDLKIDRKAKALAAQAYTRLFEEPSERWGLKGGIISQIELRERLRDRTKIFLRYFWERLKPTERDRWFLPLRSSLAVVYYFVRPVRLAMEKMRRTDQVQ